VMGANIPVAQAYIADSTTAERRARGMGMIGAAFGLGFIFGPAIGGGLSPWGYGVPGFVAAGLSLSAATAAWRWLPESLAPEDRIHDGFGALSAITGRARAAANVLARKRLRDPIGVFFIGTLGFAGFTTIFPLFLENPLGLHALHAGAMFAFMGVISATVQGGLIGPLVERHGERATAAFGGTLLAIGVVGMGLVHVIPATMVALLIVGLGWGLLAPSLQSLVSRRALANEQGQVLGVNQSASALARVIGPVAAGWAYGALGPGLGFVAGGVVVAVAAVWVRLMPTRDVEGASGEAPPPRGRAAR
jgi:DHA1 family tetracycline resistance protein-like MFS transporter